LGNHTADYLYRAAERLAAGNQRHRNCGRSTVDRVHAAMHASTYDPVRYRNVRGDPGAVVPERLVDHHVELFTTVVVAYMFGCSVWPERRPLCACLPRHRPVLGGMTE
jgi:hypothetical protein